METPESNIDRLLRARTEIDQEILRNKESVAVLFTDVEKSTDYFADRGDLAGLANVVYRHDTLSTGTVEEFGGRVVKKLGDSVMAEFSEPLSAARAAMEIQRRLAQGNRALPKPDHLRLRIGINAGSAFRFSGDLYGDDVNVAARITKHCSPDQILVSRSVFDALTREGGFSCIPLGGVEIKGKTDKEEMFELVWRDTPEPGADEPLRKLRAFARRQARRRIVQFALGVLVVVLIGLVVARKTVWIENALNRISDAPVPELKQLAVLPVSVEGGDTATIAFAKGLIDTLTGRLGQLIEQRQLQIIPEDEVRDKRVTTLDQARQEFGVNLGLKVNVHRAGDSLRILAELLDARTHKELKARLVKGSIINPFSVEDQVADAVVEELELELQPTEQTAFQARGTNKPGAYQLYLQGVGYLQDAIDAASIDRSITAFQAALQMDPGFGPALAGLGEAYWQRVDQLQQTEWVPQAKSMCDQAVASGNGGAEGHICLGLVYSGTGQYGRARDEFRHALDIEPTNDRACVGLAQAYQHLRDLDSAEKTYKQAIKIRPLYWRGYNRLGAFYYNQARYPEAVNMFLKVVKLAPDSYRGYYNLGGVYYEQGLDDQAVSALEQSLRIRPTGSAYLNLGIVYYRQRRFPDAVRNFLKATQLSPQNYQSWGNLGDAYYQGGHHAEAMNAYHEALALLMSQAQVNPHDAKLQAELAACEAMLGNRSQALTYLAESLQLGGNDEEVFAYAAFVYNQLGDTSTALKWLGRALQAGYPASVVRSSPAFDNLHGNPRYQQLVDGASTNQ
jgi:tetratricopeptide (TPR) repeat protein/class 3 adenylate cyclase